MTVDAGEGAVVRRVGVAVGAGVPRPLVLPGIDGEELGVVDGEFGRLPSRGGGVAVGAGGRDVRSDMVWIGGGIVILLMAGDAFGGSIRKVPVGVAFIAVGDRVPLCEREEGVVDACAGPGEAEE